MVLSHRKVENNIQQVLDEMIQYFLRRKRIQAIYFKISFYVGRKRYNTTSYFDQLINNNLTLTANLCVYLFVHFLLMHIFLRKCFSSYHEPVKKQFLRRRSTEEMIAYSLQKTETEYCIFGYK